VILPSGRALQIGGALALLSIGGVLHPPFGWACVGVLAALGAAVLVEGTRLPGNALAWRRRVPVRLSLGEPEPVVEELRNPASFPLAVRLALAPPPDLALVARSGLDAVVPPGAGVELRFEATGSRRGRRVLPAPVLRYGRPGGLALRRVIVPGETVLTVSPNVARLRRYEVLRQARALSAIGLHRTRYSGLGEEFDHLRLYGRDDDHRRIHWKATARRGVPITQVVRTERGQTVLVALDVSHWMGISAGRLSRLDHAVDAALFLAHVARGAGDQVGLVLFAHEVVAFLPPSSRPGQVRRIMDVLSVAQPRPVHPSYRNLARHLIERRLRRALVAVISEPPDPESAAELTAALAALRSRHLPLAVSLKDPVLGSLLREEPADVAALCRRLAAREVEEEREQRLRRQVQRGLNALDVAPGELSVALVNRYLELKARGAL